MESNEYETSSEYVTSDDEINKKEDKKDNKNKDINKEEKIEISKEEKIDFINKLELDFIKIDNFEEDIYSINKSLHDSIDVWIKSLI